MVHENLLEGAGELCSWGYVGVLVILIGFGARQILETWRDGVGDSACALELDVNCDELWTLLYVGGQGKR
jgi:hypothetical protein